MCDLLNRSCFERENNSKRETFISKSRININNHLIKLNSASDFYSIGQGHKRKMTNCSRFMFCFRCFMFTRFESFQANTQLSWNFFNEFHQNCLWLTLFLSGSVSLWLCAMRGDVLFMMNCDSWSFVLFSLWTRFDVHWTSWGYFDWSQYDQEFGKYFPGIKNTKLGSWKQLMPEDLWLHFLSP